MRTLIIDDEAKRKVKEVRNFAEKVEHYYDLDNDPFAAGTPPGDDPRHVCELNTYHCVFSMTVSHGILYRHFSMSIPSEKYPNPFAVWTVAELFGFRGWDGKSEKPPENWICSVNERGHCIVVAMPEVEHPFGSAV